MMNKTQLLLLDTARRLAEEHETTNPERRQYRREFDSAYREFRQRHRRNKLLVQEVNGLLDARTGVEETEAEYHFLLGLQMGLEMGGLDALPEL